MKIVSVASEMAPYAKTGGLADVSGSLTKELHALGHEVIAFLPCYQSIPLDQWKFETVIEKLETPIGTQRETGRVLSRVDDCGVTVYLIDHPEYFKREFLYGTALSDYPDNDVRFIFFQKAVLETLRAIGFAPDVIHCHDWQSGLIPVFLRTLYAKEPLFKKTRSVFTVHNLAYQGNFPPDSLPMTGLSWEEFKFDRLEFYGKVSFLKAGLVYGDAVTTVSDRYAREVQTKEFGCGMESVIASRKDNLRGVINGIDYREWDPSSDPDIEERYTLSTIEKKLANKRALQKENNFRQDDNAPVVGIISRLIDQKGLDILIPALDEMTRLGVQFVLLGTGEEKYHKILRDMAKKNKEQLGIHIVFDPKMAKAIYAGCDLFILPSYYEPCGLAQMIALRYGTIPVARATGGLADTIQEFSSKTGKGNGFLFEEYSTSAFLDALKRALKVYKDKDAWLLLIRNAMESDYSWTASAKKYIQIFEALRQGKIRSNDK